MTPKVKKETVKNVEFAKGGDTHMFGSGDRTIAAPADSAGQEKPGQTAQIGGANAKGKYAVGGSTKMHAYSPSLPATAGITGAR